MKVLKGTLTVINKTWKEFFFPQESSGQADYRQAIKANLFKTNEFQYSNRTVTFSKIKKVYWWVINTISIQDKETICFLRYQFQNM